MKKISIPTIHHLQHHSYRRDFRVRYLEIDSAMFDTRHEPHDNNHVIQPIAIQLHDREEISMNTSLSTWRSLESMTAQKKKLQQSFNV